MNNDIEVVDAMLENEGWHVRPLACDNTRVCCYIGDDIEDVIVFVEHDGCPFLFSFNDKVELRKAFLDANCFDTRHGTYENKWHKLSNEEALIRCDLEKCNGK